MVRGLGDKLQSQRMLHKLSQKEVASILGVSAAVISNYENGERTPSVEMLMSLAGLYHCSADYLLGLSKDTNDRLLDCSMLSDKQMVLLESFLASLR